jgi:hypothetical protein
MPDPFANAIARVHLAEAEVAFLQARDLPTGSGTPVTVITDIVGIFPELAAMTAEQQFYAFGAFASGPQSWRVIALVGPSIYYSEGPDNNSEYFVAMASCVMYLWNVTASDAGEISISSSTSFPIGENETFTNGLAAIFSPSPGREMLGFEYLQFELWGDGSVTFQCSDIQDYYSPATFSWLRLDWNSDFTELTPSIVTSTFEWDVQSTYFGSNAVGLSIGKDFGFVSYYDVGVDSDASGDTHLAVVDARTGDVGAFIDVGPGLYLNQLSPTVFAVNVTQDYTHPNEVYLATVDMTTLSMTLYPFDPYSELIISNILYDNAGNAWDFTPTETGQARISRFQVSSENVEYLGAILLDNDLDAGVFTPNVYPLLDTTFTSFVSTYGPYEVTQYSVADGSSSGLSSLPAPTSINTIEDRTLSFPAYGGFYSCLGGIQLSQDYSIMAISGTGARSDSPTGKFLAIQPIPFAYPDPYSDSVSQALHIYACAGQVGVYGAAPTTLPRATVSAADNDSLRVRTANAQVHILEAELNLIRARSQSTFGN